MLKAYRYRIYPNRQQEEQIQKTFGCCRFVYNQCLDYRQRKYKEEKESMNKTSCNNYCNQILKKEYEWLKEVDKFALTNSIYNMDSAYQRFFKNILDSLNLKANEIIRSLILLISQTGTSKYCLIGTR